MIEEIIVCNRRRPKLGLKTYFAGQENNNQLNVFTHTTVSQDEVSSYLTHAKFVHVNDGLRPL